MVAAPAFGIYLVERKAIASDYAVIAPAIASRCAIGIPKQPFIKPLFIYCAYWYCI